MAKMTDEELRALVGGEIRSSLGFLGSDLSEQRAESMKRYLGEPYGNEQADRSQIVSTDVADTIEWILPSLLKIFAAGDDVVQFAPQGPEDEEVAKQATEYVNWLFLRDNPGFLILYTWFKDALIQKNGIVKCWWEVSQQYKKQRYQGLPDEAFAILMQEVQSGDVEVIAHSEYPDPNQPPPAAAAMPVMPPTGPAPMTGGAAAPVPTPTLHDVIIRKAREYGCAKIAPVPPEEFLISREAKDIQEARFVGHRVRKTISALIEEGYDRDQVQGLSSENNSLLSSEEALARTTIADEQRATDVTVSTANQQMREVWVVECYLRVDYDDDGIAERRKITVAGTGWDVLKWGKDAPDGKSGSDNEEWEGPVPFASLTPIIMPHKFFGRSVAETIEDLALIKTTLVRQLLDALYLANNPRQEVFEDAIVEPSEVLSSKPGGIVRTNKPGPNILPIPVTPIAQEALAGIEYIDALRENRTGVTKYNQGLDADSLNKTAHGVSQIMSAAQQRIELIARVFAETGVKELFKLLLNLVTAHQQQARMVRLREQWVPMDPREWDSEMDVTINVGLGTGNKEQQAMLLTQLLQMQAQIIQFQGGVSGPLVVPDNVYKTLDRFISATGISKNAEGFFTDPQKAKPQPPKPPSPEEMKAQAEIQKMQLDAQIKQQQAHTDLAMKQADMQLEREKAAMQMQIQREQAQQDMALKQAEFEMTMRHEQAKAQMQMSHDAAMAQVNVRTAEMMGEQKLAQGEAMGAAKIDQMKKQQALKPKPQNKNG